jgi:hypothetical protein
VISRRHGLKSIFIGIVMEPIEEFGFDGNNYMQRIEYDKILDRATYQNNLHHDCIMTASSMTC